MHPLDDLLRLVGFLIGAIPIGFAPRASPSTRRRVNCGDKCRPYRAAGGPATRREGRYLNRRGIGIMSVIVVPSLVDDDTRANPP